MLWELICMALLPLCFCHATYVYRSNLDAACHVWLLFFTLCICHVTYAFRLNLHSVTAGMSANSMVETGALFEVTAKGFENCFKIASLAK